MACLLALTMLVALGLNALAAGETGSITITNPQEGRTYTAYKIFDVTYSGDNHSYTIDTDDAVYEKVAEYAAVAENGLILTANGVTKYIVTVDEAKFSAASFAKFLRENQDTLGTGTAFVADGTTMKASGLALGYYFVAGTSGTVCKLTTAKNVFIKDKNEVHEIDKIVDDADKTVEVGQVLTYTVTGKVPSAKGYTEYLYEVADTMSAGLTYNKDVRITVDGKDVTAEATVSDTENGFKANLDMLAYQHMVDKAVVITYTATVNTNAIERDKETNTAKLTHSTDPADGTKTRTTTVEVNVYSFNIVIDKYKTDFENTKLENAKFVLKNSSGRYYRYDESTGKVSWVYEKAQATEVATAADGSASFSGLEAGTYLLEETAAPDGYNQLSEDITIVITDKDTASVAGTALAPDAANLSLTAKVANSTGTVLPETGGIGTVIFISVGALAVIAAGIFLVTNKRMSKESF